MLFPCHAMLIQTCHATPLPFSDSAMSFVKVRMVDGNIQTVSLLLVTTFVELRVVAGRSWMWAGRPCAVSGRPMLIHKCHAMPMLHCAMALRSRFQNGMVACQMRMGHNTVKPAAQKCPVLDLYSFVPVPKLKRQNPLLSYVLRERERKYTVNVQCSVQYTVVLLYLMLVMSYCV
jgi:hypothetical protein